MRYLMVVISGMADEPHPGLGGRTALEVAKTPSLDAVSVRGRAGVVCPCPENHAEATRAFASLLGYDPGRYAVARGSAEALSIGVDLAPEDLALSFHFICTFRSRLADWGVRGLSLEEAAMLLRDLTAGSDGTPFEWHHTAGFRGVLIWRGGADRNVTCHPPEAALNREVAQHGPFGDDAEELRSLIERATTTLTGHEVNGVRVDLGENPAESIWPWGGGSGALRLPSFFDLHGRDGTLIAASPSIRGVGMASGLTLENVTGANGEVDTNLEAKARWALKAIRPDHVVVVHIQGGYESSRDANPEAKVAFLERVDQELLAPSLDALEDGSPYRLLVTCDRALCGSDPGRVLRRELPFALCGHGVPAFRRALFSEASARSSDLRIDPGHTLMEFFLGRRQSFAKSRWPETQSDAGGEGA